MKSKKGKITYGKVNVDDPFNPKDTKIKITAWFDADMILALREKAEKEGVKYQTYMNRLLRDVVLGKASSEIEQRLLRIEQALFDKHG